MKLGCTGCLAMVIVLALVALLLGGAVGAGVRMLGRPDVSQPVTTAADGARAQQKLFDLARHSRPGDTVALTEAEVNALLARHLVEVRGIRLAGPGARLLGGDRLELTVRSSLGEVLDEASLGAVAVALPGRWRERPMWLRLGARARVEEGPKRHLRLDVDDFVVGRQRLPTAALRLLVDPAVVGLLRWPLPQHVESIKIEPGRVVIRTASTR